ncbi:aminotransferase class V-fold PLP-dependent enzyme [Dactylosporangium aurantiacum]|uniref:Aminotransferase class V-fold PLP-dependent enzyme n=1 Tax=Dactylosporangium aurantiacum TaxID=35754 RepID=A0A9Q9IT03_9ACTN|nr:aminotransferase class V-fold PLP-dependent enzyme [Dactylosporangium aurantiacum]MDG6103917.1 aminotransferase class V-fold PLP-dependent enzyme [Dactylosporangium aurantiacum]UWZ58894.1 aminotransferase class V-fold PLP-dependent enzyme [Dactylosporangium aurantiacum]
MPTDPRGLRGDAPLLDAWLRFGERTPAPFTIPGHKQRTDLVGDVVAGDVPLYAGLDTMKLSTGVLADAESRAARLWGADLCRFSTGGATHANQAVALAVAADGDRVVVSRTLHRSLLLGLVLAGLTPVWVRPDVDPATGLPLGVAPATVRRALAAHPDARAVFVGDPSYVGTVGDVAGLAAAAHEAGWPLIVDAAWAAHFGFHPALPRHPLQLGADVMVTSAHKTLPAWSQAALVLARTGRVDPARLDAGVEATATTSPAGAILASTDAARALLRRDGEALLGDAITATAEARDRLRAVDGLTVLDGPAVDPLKLTLLLAGTGADGNLVERDLLAAGLPVESADRDVLVAVVSLADTHGSLTRLTTALTGSLHRHRGAPRPVVGSAVYQVDPVQAMPPRQAFFAAVETLPTARTVGRVCAELVAPYPPGIPILAPGEQVTAEVLGALEEARRAGVRIAYAADPSLATLRVVNS